MLKNATFQDDFRTRGMPDTGNEHIAGYTHGTNRKWWSVLGSIDSVRRPTQTVSYTSIILTWIGLFLYDLMIAGYEAPYDQQGLFRALAPVLSLIPAFLRWLKPVDAIENDKQAYKTFINITIGTLTTLGVVTALSVFPMDITEAGGPASIWSFLMARMHALTATVGFVYVVEQLIRLYRYRSQLTPSRLAVFYPYAFVGGVILNTFWLRGENNSSVSGISSLIGLFGLILSVRAGWTVSLPRTKKLKLLGTSFFTVAAIVLVYNSQSGAALLSYFPGLLTLGFGAVMSVMFAQLGVFIYAVMALPTAQAIDRRNTEVSSLANFGRLLTESFDERELVDTAISIACDVTTGAAAWMEMINGDVRDFLYGSCPLVPHKIANGAVNAAQATRSSLAKAVRASEQIEVRNGVQGVRWMEQGGKMRQLQSIVAVPLKSGKKLIGVLYVGKEQAYGFDREDIAVLGVIGDQITLALDHSRLIHSSLEKERFEQEMIIARGFQQQLLPRNMPQSPAYALYAESEPASIVGGDYYDVLSFSDRTLGVAIADVSGKGASAALYMAMVKGIIQALSGQCANPKELLAQTNSSLYGNIDSRSFVTMTCAQIVEDEKMLRIARAGHCPTMIITGGNAHYSKPNGFGLAMTKPYLFNKSLEMEEIRMNSDDFAVFFSDGLAEARRADGEELGYDGLLKIADDAAKKCSTPEELRHTIFTGISTFTNGGPLDDDSTIVILRWS